MPDGFFPGEPGDVLKRGIDVFDFAVFIRDKHDIHRLFYGVGKLQNLLFRPFPFGDLFAQLVVRLLQFACPQINLFLQIPLQPRQRQVVFNTSQHLLRLKRLGDIIHPADGKSSHLVQTLGHRAEKDHRDVARLVVGLQALADFITIHNRHSDIQHDQINRSRFDELERLLSAGFAVDGIATYFQDILKKPQIRQVVINDEDISSLRGGRFIFAAHSLFWLYRISYYLIIIRNQTQES